MFSGLPVNLRGRDVLSQLKVIIFNPNAQVSNMMFRQSYIFLGGPGIYNLCKAIVNIIALG